MKLVLNIDDYDLDEALKAVAAFGTDRFGYVVTPNVDHVIRYYEDRNFQALYAHAAYILLDSRFLAHTLRLVKGQAFRVCLGSDLTTAALQSVIKPFDVIVLVGGTAAQAQILRDRYGLRALHHIDPPMNLMRNPGAVENCLREIEAIGAFRFCFLAVGSPQQEMIAQKLQERGSARGLALCVGAAVDFLTGVERRAPRWVQQIGFEWFFRLTQNPRRLIKRHFIRGPAIFPVLSKLELRVRRPVVMSMESEVAAARPTALTTTPISS